MKEELITKAYEVAKERYAALGIDVEKVMEQLPEGCNLHALLAGR